MTPQQFIAKWQRANLSERAAYQQHFLDLCELLDHPKPAEADPEGTSFTFERGCRKIGGERGWADVWKWDFFGWEYKGKHKNLNEAYRQLLLYREALENPPLLVVCDLDRFEIRTNFTRKATVLYAFDLAGLAEPANLEILRKVFCDPDALSPEVTREKITEEAADRFGELADGMRLRGVPAERAGHFLMKLIFCMFGERIGLLPSGVFSRIVEAGKVNPASLNKRLTNLFRAMAHGGPFGEHDIAWFDGGLFADADVIPLTIAEAATLAQVAKYDWASIEPSVFGTLFERILDPDKRSQIGAHYTSREDIETLLVPVFLTPLRREWEEVVQKCEGTLSPGAAGKATGRRSKSAMAKPSASRRRFERELLNFAERLAHIAVLDPACGSGNFLYVALHMLLDLEKKVIAYAATRGLAFFPHVNPTQLHGLEINAHAQQLAQVAIWIGYLQWMHHNGFKPPDHPVLAPIESIRHTDAIVDLSDPEHPNEPEWPEAEFIVGNPPFLGGKLLRTNLGDEYVDQMFHVWDGRVPKEADLCCYWFEKARSQIERGKCSRAGLLATQGIRGGANRKVLQAIKESGDVFFAESDRDWILDGAAVHVSMVGFDDGTEKQHLLDGQPVEKIHANLSAAADTTTARAIAANLGISFMGDTKVGPFEIDEPLAMDFLNMPTPHGRTNSDVVVPWVNGLDVTRRVRGIWIIDFPRGTSLDSASLYEGPFAYIEEHVRPVRKTARSGDATGVPWWIHQRPRPEMRRLLAAIPRFLATTTVSKHRLFTWMECPTLPDHQLIVFARCEDGFFGILHCRVHEVWARAQGTQVREVESGFRYTPTSCFETFPLPEPTKAFAAAIGEAACELDALRSRWLNPPEWTKTEVLEFPGSVDGPWARYIDPATVRPCPRLPSPAQAGEGPGVRGRRAGKSSPRAHRPHPSPLPEGEGTRIGTVRWPRVVPKDPDCAASLKDRTLTNLYNERPTWLDLAHQKLDAAVFAAYGWDPDISDEQLLERLLALNLERSKA